MFTEFFVLVDVRGISTKIFFQNSLIRMIKLEKLVVSYASAAVR